MSVVHINLHFYVKLNYIFMSPLRFSTLYSPNKCGDGVKLVRWCT